VRPGADGVTLAHNFREGEGLSTAQIPSDEAAHRRDDARALDGRVDLIGRTREQLRSLHFQPDRNWLQSCRPDP
jgi:hypothetical protein